MAYRRVWYLPLHRAWPRSLFFARWRTPVSHPIVAVLPFVNMSEERANDDFSDGLTEELIDRLAKVEGLRVVARTSTFQFKGRAQDLREVGRKLEGHRRVRGQHTPLRRPPAHRRSADRRVRRTAHLVRDL